MDASLQTAFSFRNESKIFPPILFRELDLNLEDSFHILRFITLFQVVQNICHFFNSIGLFQIVFFCVVKVKRVVVFRDISLTRVWGFSCKSVVDAQPSLTINEPIDSFHVESVQFMLCLFLLLFWVFICCSRLNVSFIRRGSLQEYVVII